VTEGSRAPRALQHAARWRVPLGFVAGAAVIGLAAPTPASYGAGLSIALTGQALRLWAAGHLDKSRELTRSGPYRWMRHPLYVGSTLLAAGGAVASASIWVAALVAVYVIVAIGAAIATEDAYLRGKFGDAYLRWREGVQGDAARSFSWRRALVQNREYRSVAGLAAMAVVLALRGGLLN
jgi:protein-S-isoprenylcysteine O-methyltransferase Ste14